MYNMNDKYQQCMDDELEMNLQFTPSLYHQNNHSVMDNNSVIMNNNNNNNDINVNIEHGHDSSEDEKIEFHHHININNEN